MSQIPTTQRAYTLRLRGIDKDDQSWRDAIWATHKAVNRGAKVFGDWLLTLRGGLDHRLAEDGDPLHRKDRRILLALSWLSVEDSHGAPRDESLIVARGDAFDSRCDQLTAALTSILAARGLDGEDIAGWLSDCKPSISAAIRKDAVWVNRSAAFDNAVARCPELDRDEVWDFLAPFFGSKEAYLKPARLTAEEDQSETSVKNEEKAKDLVQKAGGWLSKRMGTGQGADFSTMAKAYDAISDWAAAAAAGNSGAESLRALAHELEEFSPNDVSCKGVLSVISGPGYKSATINYVRKIDGLPKVDQENLAELARLAREDAAKCQGKSGGKGPRPYSTLVLQDVEEACGYNYQQPDGPARHREFSVMLDHAARRINVAHSWIKNAEAERREFEDDARRLGNVPSIALDWLQRYCQGRAIDSGSLGSYRIRKRAIDGWDSVVDRWSRADCESSSDRISAARALQDDPESKFGDTQLFEALAADGAVCVWKPDGSPSVKPLHDFVFASEAEAKRQRFKVPSYRHPDPLRHPVFTDFGNSRWDIEFSAHRAPAKLHDLAQKVEKIRRQLLKIQEKRQQAARASQTALDEQTDELRSKLQGAQRKLDAMSDPHRLEMRLWTGAAIETVPLHWACKRLSSNLSLGPEQSSGGPQEEAKAVARADRLGRAASSVASHENVTISGLFDQQHWNGRLQAPRAQLDEIARRVEKHGWSEKTRAMLGRIRWLVSFSAELEPQGPWCEFAQRHGLRPDPKYWPHSEANKKRKAHSRLILSRLPGLRLLSVDLGHRFAAACAVWEAITREQIDQSCVGAGVPPPAAAAMYAHLKSSVNEKSTTTIYRRIGPDFLLDGSPHPAPWARLDRQFLIKLQGEERVARKASKCEIDAVGEFEGWAGFIRAEDGPRRKLAVDALMSATVRTARLAVSRHSRRARIAYNLVSKHRMRPGARLEALDDASRIDHLTEVLMDWHSLAIDDEWQDDFALQIWNQEFAAAPFGFVLKREDACAPLPELSPDERRKRSDTLRDRIRLLAIHLAERPALRSRLHEAWADRWQTDDKQWRGRLKWLSRWLMPRGRTRSNAGRRNVGGLSIKRIATLTEFRRKVQVGFYTRMKPDGSHAELGPAFGQSTLCTIERLKDNRIKQLASRIVEAALGIGIEKHGARDLPRPRERILNARFAPCHAVVIEDLSHYRPEETSFRRENRATMDWKSAETKKRLEDHCELYGLHLRDVNPQYTSRQDSRTGAPGARCADVRVRDFLTKPWWRKQIRSARAKGNGKECSARDRCLIALYDKWEHASEEEIRNARPLRIPLKSGSLFVSAADSNVNAAGIQADLNAAANIGLRALIDPDFPGKWWYVPCDPASGTPSSDKVKGAIVEGVKLFEPSSAETKQGSKKGSRKSSNAKQREVVNRWRDPDSGDIRGLANDEAWLETAAYWADVESRVIGLLQRSSILREARDFF